MNKKIGMKNLSSFHKDYKNLNFMEELRADYEKENADYHKFDKKLLLQTAGAILALNFATEGVVNYILPWIK